MKKVLSITAAVVLTGCASTSPADNWQQYVTPKPNGLYTADARGTSADEAKQTALLIARAACTANTGSLSVVNESGIYDGPTGGAQAIESLMEIGAALYGHNTGTYYGWDDDANYKNTLDFKCGPT
ncbi:MAG: hypothetical protein AB9Q19_00505 [Candidatus Reddybacter sp.]